ncbi:Nitroreductase [Frankineae bacterium MT45]|nr:Nitroreductase [Frankineae bacterium MT45]
MEFQEVVRARRMVRSYDAQRPVAPELIERLLGLAVRAPSAGFSQGWEFLVLDTPERVGRYWEVTTDADTPPDRWLRGMQSAPVLILPFSDKSAYIERYAEPDKGWSDRDESRWPVPYWHIDTGMASLLVLLGAVDAGLSGCFFGVPVAAQDAVRQTFAVPSQLTPIGVISLGYPAPDRRSPSLRRGRRPVSEVAHYGSF